MTDITMRFELEIGGKVYSAEKSILEEDAESSFTLNLFVGSFIKNIERNTYKTLKEYGYESMGLD